MTEESKKMIQDTTARLKKATEALTTLIVRPFAVTCCALNRTRLFRRQQIMKRSWQVIRSSSGRKIYSTWLKMLLT